MANTPVTKIKKSEEALIRSIKWRLVSILILNSRVRMMMILWRGMRKAAAAAAAKAKAVVASTEMGAQRADRMAGAATHHDALR